MKSRITKLAAAAVIVLAVFVGLHQLGGPIDGASVSWANVLKNMEAINSYTCRMTSWQKPAQSPDGTESAKEEEVVMRFWYSCEYGFRMEQHTNGVPTLIEYMLRKTNEGGRILTREKKYFRKQLTDQDLAIMNQQEMDPREWVRRILAANYKPLGKDVIGGVKVEGVEINELGVIRKSSGQLPLKNYAARLWVDVESQLPVRLEEEYTMDSVRSGVGADQFQWNVELTAADIEPNIPADYVSEGE